MPYKFNPITGELDYYESSTASGLQQSSASGIDVYTTTITGVTVYADGDAYLIRFTNGNTTTSS